MEPVSKYEKARKKVKDIKGFYNHLAVYLVVNSVLILTRTTVVFFFLDLNRIVEYDGFQDWIDLNLFVTPLLWGIILFIHYINVFGIKPGFVKRWEKRKLDEYLGEEGKKQEWL